MEVASGTGPGSAPKSQKKRVNNVSLQGASSMESDVSRRVGSVKGKRGDAMGTYQVVLPV